jgi:hypothetical protein
MDPQIVFNMGKLTNTISEPVTIVSTSTNYVPVHIK